MKRWETLGKRYESGLGTSNKVCLVNGNPFMSASVCINFAQRWHGDGTCLLPVSLTEHARIWAKTVTAPARNGHHTARQ
jgi:hypothetical protein